MISNDTALMAHLLRRAGFGANRNELEEYLAMGYDGAVEALLNPSDPGNMPDDLIRRFTSSNRSCATWPVPPLTGCTG